MNMYFQSADPHPCSPLTPTHATHSWQERAILRNWEGRAEGRERKKREIKSTQIVIQLMTLRPRRSWEIPQSSLSLSLSLSHTISLSLSLSLSHNQAVEDGCSRCFYFPPSSLTLWIGLISLLPVYQPISPMTVIVPHGLGSPQNHFTLSVSCCCFVPSVWLGAGTLGDQMLFCGLA